MVIAVESLNVAYAAVPKAACSSVKAALALADDSVPHVTADTVDDIQVHGIYQTRRFRGDYWEMAKRAGVFGFTVVREPVRRALSAYVNRVVQFRELHGARAIKRGQTDLPPDPDPDFFFQNLRAYMAISSSIKHHMLPTHVFTGSDLGVYDAVYQVEDIARLPRDLTRHVGQPISLPRRNATGQRLGLEDLRPETLGALRDHLEKDYRLLSDIYPSPF